MLLEFGEWLYRQNFPKEDVQQQVQFAIDIFLQKESDQTGGTGISKIFFIIFIGIIGVGIFNPSPCVYIYI